MADPISEQIVAKVKTRLEGITTANGYAVTLSAVERYDPRKGIDAADLKAGIWERDEEAEDSPQGYFEWLKQFGIVVSLFDAADSGTNPDRRVNIVRGAIEKALMTDPQWGQLANNTFLRGVERFQPTPQMYGFIVYFDIQYQVLESDPTLQ